MSLPRLHAPSEHGQILAVPSLDQAEALLEANRRILDSDSHPIAGRSLRELRALARREVQAASAHYHLECAQPAPAEKDGAWIVAGHQPELFHPGVWFKNFAMHQLAENFGAQSLNLIIDTDAAKPAVLHAPAADRLARVPFDRSTAEAPYEERIVEDEATFAELPARLASITSSWGFEPLLGSFWTEVMSQARRTPLLGERLAAARRAIERRWGILQREAPMSRVCETQAFAWFACDILDSLPEFHAVYNQTVREYRQAHGLRSRSHPVPDLTTDGDWLEAPFWGWRHGQARRGKLFVRRTRAAWELRVGDEAWPSLPGDRLDRAAEAWQSLESQGCKIRPRALTTTLFARLFLADLFIHGIGGGIYDELTDRIIERYYKIAAPAFLVLSATLLLPLPRHADAAEQSRLLARRLRDIVFKPERFIDPDARTAPLLRTKQEWIARSCADHAERIERFRHIREINARLQPSLASEMQRSEADLRHHLHDAAWDAVASRRDYAFCLYPEKMLREFFGHAILDRR